MRFKSNARSAKVSNPRARNTKFGNRGFTLIEMLVVISMILILLSIALPMYNNSIIRARETTLKQNLTTINKCIDQYTLDKQKAPQALGDLVSAGYLKKVPDDITGSPDSWQCDQEDSLKSIDQTQPGIVGCHSGSDQTSIDGPAYSSWVY
jgi:general secretion pathway protein G